MRNELFIEVMKFLSIYCNLRGDKKLQLGPIIQQTLESLSISAKAQIQTFIIILALRYNPILDFHQQTYYLERLQT